MSWKKNPLEKPAEKPAAPVVESLKPAPAPVAAVVAKPAAAPKPVEACASCRLYREGIGGALGRCRRFPPEKQGDHPAVRADDWCGEFRAKEGA